MSRDFHLRNFLFQAFNFIAIAFLFQLLRWKYFHESFQLAGLLLIITSAIYSAKLILRIDHLLYAFIFALVAYLCSRLLIESVLFLWIDFKTGWNYILYGSLFSIIAILLKSFKTKTEGRLEPISVFLILLPFVFWIFTIFNSHFFSKNAIFDYMKINLFTFSIIILSKRLQYKQSSEKRILTSK